MATKLDKNKIPPALHHLVPLAERFGIVDATERERLVRASSQEEKKELKAAISQYDDELDKWLAGPEAQSVWPTDEYVAFSAMRMAADYA